MHTVPEHWFKMEKKLVHIALLLLFCLTGRVQASHIVGGEVYYKFLKDTTVMGVPNSKYEITLTIYEDCLNGNSEAIHFDNPALIAIFDSSSVSNISLVLEDSIFFVSHDILPANFSNSCLHNPPTVCLLRTVFVKSYCLPHNLDGYIVSYQRCCRNAAIVNIRDPSATGATYLAHIPAPSVALHNNSAVFNNFPPQIICVNNPLVYDNSATDADGDSLSYSFFPSLICDQGTSSQPGPPKPPPYGRAIYVPPYSYLRPMIGNPQIQINPATGLITGTPTVQGRYLVTVCCYEWRGGKIINTVAREFQFVVTNCSKTVVADIPQYSTDFNTYIVDCKNYSISFANTSSGGSTYHWDFGVPSVLSDTSADFAPTFTYPDTGTYVVKLNVNPQTTCQDSIWRYVKVYPYYTTRYTDSGYFCPGDTIRFLDRSTSTLQAPSDWVWSFGDGTFSSQQNVTHIYTVGGSYLVMLSSGNDRNCRDTMVSGVVIEEFLPFAGNDTIIVKDELIHFDAHGGLYYTWSPSVNLNDTAGNSPTGYYPDTGSFTYVVYVQSSYGCKGYDTMKVQVVSKPSFFVPSAFSPNGDGKNDFFRPVAIGYRDLNYFRVFDRWGQLVYFSRSFETGWDGTFDGRPLDVDVYFWEIGYTDRYGKQGTQKGDVTLLR